MSGTATLFTWEGIRGSNAEADRTTFSANAQRQNTMGGTWESPIKKNKIFNFASFEYWKVGNPGELCRHGADLSGGGREFLAVLRAQCQRASRSIRTVYDPWTTVTSPNGTITRDAFRRQYHPGEPHGSRRGQLHEEVLAGQQSGSEHHRRKQLRQRLYRRLELLQLGRSRGLECQRQVENIRPRGTLPHDGYHLEPDPQRFSAVSADRNGSQRHPDERRTQSGRSIRERSLDFHADYDSVVDAYNSTPLPSSGWGAFWGSNQLVSAVFLPTPPALRFIIPI